MKHVFITGTAGFIGFWMAKKLVEEGYRVTGYDNVNDYYDVNLKRARLQESGIDVNSIQYGKPTVSANGAYTFIKGDLADRELLLCLFRDSKFDYVIHLAAQAGVRYSLTHPHVYTESNVTGFLNVLEACREYPVQHLLYASSSSVYGLNSKMPLSEDQTTDHPISLYAATKKANEMMAHSYSHLFSIPTTGLRFFTVYGPWGRPDMALFLFTKAILAGKPIQLFNEGKMIRDFTYVEDVVESISKLLSKAPEKNDEWDNFTALPDSSSAPYRLLNIGNSNPVPLIQYVDAIEYTLGIAAVKEMLPMQAGDVPRTHANCNHLELLTGYKPTVTIETGVAKFIDWYKVYYKPQTATQV
jgi:UDP-glucuronate 4-epimerase